MASFRDIDYRLRPAKAVERKMIVEAIRRLGLSWSLSDYRYVGLGSIYFADFLMVHQALNLSDMISMEREIGDKPRFEFNRPYRCVQIKFGDSIDILPKLPWDKRCILWLDYDDNLRSSMIADLKTAAQSVTSGSVVLISINVGNERPPQDIAQDARASNEWRLREFSERIGRENVPLGVDGAMLRGASLSKVSWKVLSNAVTEQLVARNGRGDMRSDTLLAKQIIHFGYADGSPMLSVGWVFYTHSEQALADRCDFDSIGFCRGGDEPIKIFAPILTPKEIRHFNAALPDGTLASSDASRKLAQQTGVPEIDIHRFAEVYRYYPHYAEIAL
jgi:hypothetical protein